MENLHEKIAKNFSAILLEWIGTDNMAEVIKRNKEYDPSTCASHDFCDANMAMLEAMEANGYPYPLSEDEEVHRKEMDAYFDIVNPAWNIAKRNNFYYEAV